MPKWRYYRGTRKEKRPWNRSTMGLDVRSMHFQAHGANKSGEACKKLRRQHVLPCFAALPFCTQWKPCQGSLLTSRQARPLDQTARAYVKPFVKQQKNDASGAEAICEAAELTTMRFVPAKTDRLQRSYSQRATYLSSTHPGAERFAWSSDRVQFDHGTGRKIFRSSSPWGTTRIPACQGLHKRFCVVDRAIAFHGCAAREARSGNCAPAKENKVPLRGRAAQSGRQHALLRIKRHACWAPSPAGSLNAAN
jgi:hypothetical protein